jgi:hypothetical protein
LRRETIFATNTSVPKWAKMIIAILLLPFCAGAVRALLQVLRMTNHAETMWVAAVGGAACWLVIFLLLPKPMRFYVFGHELTHVLWTWLFGGRVKKFKTGAAGGHVVVTKNNFLIALAPYFFPLYAVSIVAGFLLGHLIWGWERHLVWFHLLLGAAYCFHVTLTVHILQTRQSDITSQGYLFSCVIIFLGNISVWLVGVPLLTREVSVLTSLGLWLRESGTFLLRFKQIF